MNGTKRRLTPEEEKTARALLDKDLEGMMAMVFLQRRETDAELLNEMHQLGEKMDALGDRLEELAERMDGLTPRVKLTEQRIKEVNFWLQQIHDTARDVKHTEQARDTKSKLSVTSGKRSGSGKTPRDRGKTFNRDPEPSPNLLLRQKTQESLSELVKKGRKDQENS